MSFEQSLQDRWAADAELAALIAPDRVFTGHPAETAPPRAVIAVLAARPLWLASGGVRWEERRVRITVEDEDYGRAAAVGDRMTAVFHRAAWEAEPALAVVRCVCLRRGPTVARSASLWRQTSDWSALLRIADEEP
ncbi:MAG: hypothetical protein GYA33_15380 [Thermogutta sp.]|nr:hypothetical protein [Thermogutta sp.]